MDLTGSVEMRQVFGNEGDGYEIYQKTYEDNRFLDRSEVLCPKIAIDDVLATQALAMQLLREQSRSVMRGDRRHGFSLLNSVHSQRDELYDGSLEEYMACRVAKVSHDQWRMRVRFRQNELTEEMKKSSFVDDFSFDWLRNGNLQAWYGNYMVKATPEGTFEQWKDITPITPLMIETLHDRMRLHSNQAVGAVALHQCREFIAKNKDSPASADEEEK